jgi:hypothetical protein
MNGGQLSGSGFGPSNDRFVGVCRTDRSEILITSGSQGEFPNEPVTDWPARREGDSVGRLEPGRGNVAGTRSFGDLIVQGGLTVPASARLTTGQQPDRSTASMYIPKQRQFAIPRFSVAPHSCDRAPHLPRTSLPRIHVSLPASWHNGTPHVCARSIRVRIQLLGTARRSDRGDRATCGHEDGT